MRVKQVIVLLLWIGSLVSVAEAQQVRKYSNEFLSIGAGGRGLGMANSIIATVDDATSVYYNPAGLTRIENNLQVSFMHSDYFAGLSGYDFGAMAIKTSDNSVLGLGIVRYGADNIPNTFDLIDKNGVVNYNAVSSFSVADYAFIISFAQKQRLRSKRFLKSPLRYGGSAKVIYRNVGPFANAYGFGFDAGAQYQLDDNNYIGVSIRDLTRTFNAWSFHFSEHDKSILSGTGNDIPSKTIEVTNPRIILSYARRFLNTKTYSFMGEITTDITTDGRRNVLIPGKLASIDPHFGLEAGYKQTVFLRAGIGSIQSYTSDDPAKKGQKIYGFQPAIGLGLKFKRIAFDYAFTDLGNFSVGLYSHILALRVSIDKKRK